MKTPMQLLLRSCLAAGLTAGAALHAAAPADDAAPTPTPKKNAPRVQVVRPAGVNAPAAEPKEVPTLRLNFRGVPLELVLNYLSDAAGFTIILDTPVKGTVDVWNNQPLTKAQAVEVLNSALNKNGYAAIQNERTLTIVTKEEAKKRNTPVKQGSDPEDIPKNDEIVTQIMPVSHISAAQLIRDLQPLIPASAAVAANEGGNAIIITDTQANIRHLAEIIKAIDTSASSIASIKVFALRYADSKSVAAVIKELFTTDSTRTSGAGTSGGRSGGFPFGGLPGFGGDNGGGSDRGSSRSTSSRGPAAARVAAVADERSNSVVVTAPDDVMPTIEELVKSVDTNVEDVTELRVFRLKYSDPTEMAQLLTNLFPDESKANNNPTSSRFGFGFGGFGGSQGFGGNSSGGGRSATAGDASDRAKKQTRVLAVPDQRTASVVVSTSHELMKQIEQMIEKLDSDPRRKQKVFVYDLQNADPAAVQEVLRSLFESQQSSRNSRSSGSQNSALTTRQSQSQQNNTGIGGNRGTGGGTGGAGGGGGGFGRGN